MAPQYAGKVLATCQHIQGIPLINIKIQIKPILEKPQVHSKIDCIDHNLLDISDSTRASNLIFVISDGAYYYLGMINDKSEYQQKLEEYKKEAIKILKIKA